MVSGSKRAVLLICPFDQGAFEQALYWPDTNSDWTGLSHAAQSAFHSRQIIIKTRHDEIPDTGEPLDALACPLVLNGDIFGILAIEMTHRSQAMQHSVVQQIQTGTKWLEILIQLTDSTARSQMINLIDLVAVGLDHENFSIAATEVTNELATRFECAAVSLGFLHNNRVQVEVVSRSSQIDNDSNLVREIQDAMNEAVDQGAVIVYPPLKNSNALITKFNARLAKSNEESIVCTIPLVKNDKAVGALVLKRNSDKPFNPKTLKQIERISLLLGPILETRRNEERPITSKVLRAAKNKINHLLGKGHNTLKLTTIVCLILAFLIFFAKGNFQVAGDSVLEAEILRAVVAPQQGFIASAHVRAGDMVQAGERLASLDDRELMFEQRKWQSEHGKLKKEYRKALTGQDRAEIAILKAKRTQAEAQLKLVQQQLRRINLVAPFTGLVVRGDLTQAIGSPVERGEVLYEIAPTGGYRVVIKISEQDIGLVTAGQQGCLKLASIPDRSIDITILRLTPVATSEHGQNFFRVEAVMNSPSDLLRPGMQGVAKITIGSRKLIWVWTRPALNWMRLFIWNRMP